MARRQPLAVTRFKNNPSESTAEALLKELEDIRRARNPTALAQLLFLLGVIRSSFKISPLAKRICSKGNGNVCAAKQNIFRSQVTMMLNQAESPDGPGQRTCGRGGQLAQGVLAWAQSSCGPCGPHAQTGSGPALWERVSVKFGGERHWHVVPQEQDPRAPICSPLMGGDYRP